MENAIVELVSVIGAIAGSFVVGLISKVTNKADAAVANAVKPIKPLLVYGAAFGLPKLAAAIGIVPPDAAMFIDAPTATVFTIAAREALRAINKKKGPTLPASTP